MQKEKNLLFYEPSLTHKVGWGGGARSKSDWLCILYMTPVWGMGGGGGVKG